MIKGRPLNIRGYVQLVEESVIHVTSLRRETPVRYQYNIYSLPRFREEKRYEKIEAAKQKLGRI